MMSAQAQTRRTMSNALALLEDLMESIHGEQKERLSQTIAELEAIENDLEENDEEEFSLRDTSHNTDSLP
jgi:predicted metallo-beta-lactamase superfamily hydrolase